MHPEPTPIRRRILEAAQTAFLRKGFSASTAEIARLARVSKRDLYANFAGKHELLAACIAERAEAMRQPLSLPVPTSKAALRETLIQYGMAVLQGLARPEVLATYRLALTDTDQDSRVAKALDSFGRAHATAGLTALIVAVQQQGLLGNADSQEIADVFLGILTRGGVLMRMLMRVLEPPGAAEIRRRAESAAECLERLYGT